MTPRLARQVAASLVVVGVLFALAAGWSAWQVWHADEPVKGAVLVFCTVASGYASGTLFRLAREARDEGRTP